MPIQVHRMEMLGHLEPVLNLLLKADVADVDNEHHFSIVSGKHFSIVSWNTIFRHPLNSVDKLSDACLGSFPSPVSTLGCPIAEAAAAASMLPSSSQTMQPMCLSMAAAKGTQVRTAVQQASCAPQQSVDSRSINQHTLVFVQSMLVVNLWSPSVWATG